MLQAAVISESAKVIVNNLLWEVRKDDFLSEPHRKIIVSLYASMPQANPEITKLFSELKVDLLRFITKKELDVLKSEYSDVIQFLYDSYGRDGSFYVRKENKNSWVPKGLVDLCLSIAQPEDGANIYLPFSGEGQFGYYLPKCEIEGFEIEPIDWAFSQILLDSNGTKADISLCDLTTPSQTTKKYNYIFTIPPFANGRVEKEKFIIDQLYNLAVKSLKANGEMYSILPMAFCNASSGWGDLRKLLFENFPQFSAVVISLPNMQETFTSINICLLVLIKDNKNRVILIDASGSEFFATHDIAGYTDIELKVESIIETINKQDEQHMWVGYPTDLTDSLNLTPSRYLVNKYLPIPKKGKERLLPLSEIVEIVSKTRLEYRPIEQQFIDVNMLSSNYLNCEILSKNITPSEITKPGVRKRKIDNNDCLLFSFFREKTKVGKLVGFSEDQIVTVHGFITPFKLKSDAIREDFLLRELMSENTLRQLKMFNSSSDEKTQIRDFLNICIIAPSPEEQERLCKEDTRVSLTEADRKLLDSAEEFRRDMHIKKHAIGQTIFNLNNWWRILQNTRSKNNGVLRDSDVVGVSNPIEVSRIFENLSVIMNQLQTQISRFDRGNGLVVTKFALTDFIERYIKTHPNALFSFEYDSTTHRASQDLPMVDIDEENNNLTVYKDEYVLRQGDPLEYVNFAEDALTIIFDNIISNACAHGFVNLEPARNIVSIEIRSEGTDYIVAISNNGHALSDIITQDDIFLYGRSTKLGKDHFGIGAYEVRQLMREFGGDARFISTPNQAFTVAYELIFHNTNIEYSF